MEPKLIYEPADFIRCHGSGRNDGPPDTSTSIWDVAFEPDVHNSAKLTNNVATCGGDAICITNIETGKVLMKYEQKEKSDVFYTLTWVLFPCENGTNQAILASGSQKGGIYFFLPKKKVCFYIWPFTTNLQSSERKRKRSVSKKDYGAVNSLVFHSKKKHWLFIALGSGDMYLYDIGSDFKLPKYGDINPQQLLKFEPNLGEVYNIVWTGIDSKWLIAGAQRGMVAWKIEEEKISPNQATQPTAVYFNLPKSSRKSDDENVTVVDSISMLNERLLLCKCVKHGCIYVINLESTVKDIKLVDGSSNLRIEKDTKVIAKLDWSKTDDYYMNIGCNSQGLICCGDNVGSIWVYDEPVFNMMLGQGDSPALLRAAVRLMWPPIQDDRLEDAEERPEKDRYNICVNKIAVSQNGEKIVAVTSNNMICIWKRRPDEMQKK